VNRDQLMRRALWFSVIYNCAAAFLFAFPSSMLGRFAGLPSAVPGLYRTLLAFFVLLFAGAYAWLARRPDIDRPLVAFAAIGKAGAFAIVLALWLERSGPGRGVLAAGGDLVLAVIFVWWLVGEKQNVPAASAVVAR
jgi:hypothetical protein